MLVDYREVEHALADLISARRSAANRQAERDAARPAQQHAKEMYGLGTFMDRCSLTAKHADRREAQAALDDAARKALAERDSSLDPVYRAKCEKLAHGFIAHSRSLG